MERNKISSFEEIYSFTYILIFFGRGDAGNHFTDHHYNQCLYRKISYLVVHVYLDNTMYSHAYT